ncbi:MAG: autotransporter domain-containing protein [Endomicrobium sp.]|jgi:outer membrane protein OmpA-like peptidoglycan-associated protein/uncharacterized protein YhjY with autotransporter beta-barrel domain|nr:autotransporter domain-containing protein [Endomicrobium sp.]
MKKSVFLKILIILALFFVKAVSSQAENHDLYSTYKSLGLKNFRAGLPRTYNIPYNYAVNGKFAALNGLTFNQKEIANVIDRILLNPPSSFGTTIDNLFNNLNENEQRHALSKLSGYFLANVIRNAASGSPSGEIYGKIKNHAKKDMANNGIWAQTKVGREIFKSDGNSVGDYKNLFLGAMGGFDRYIEKKGILYGIYAGIDKDRIEQRSDKADGQRGGFGLYGGYFKGFLELKGMLFASADKFDTKRKVFGKTAKAAINAATVNADIEGALKLWFTKHINLRPFAGIEVSNTHYGRFKETGASEYNLDVRKGNYFRSAARSGITIEYETEKRSFYAGVEAKYLMSENKPEIKSSFKHTNMTFRSAGSEEGWVEYGIGAGTEFEIIKNLKAFANVNLIDAEKYGSLAVNTGIMFSFGKKSSSLNKEIKRAKKLADKAYEESEQITKRQFTQEYYETQDLAYIGVEYANAALNLSNRLEDKLKNNFEANAPYRTKIEKKIEGIADKALAAKQRIIEFVFGIKDLEGAKILATHAKDIIDDVEYKTENGEIDNESAIGQSALAVHTADDALRKLEKSKEKFAFAHRKLSDVEIDALEKRLKEAEIKTLYTRNRAVKLIENEKHKISVRKAEERRNNSDTGTLKFNAAVFDVNDITLTAEAEKILKNIADELKKYEYSRIIVEGHTDNVGTHETNLTLSKQRAIAVRDKLVEYGIPEDKINYTGLGATMPVQTNVTEEGRIANRRTIIFVE